MPKEVWNNPDDVPELGDEFFERANEYQGDRLVGAVAQVGSGNKISSAVSFDSDVIDAFVQVGLSGKHV
jgi:hypothetical protein